MRPDKSTPPAEWPDRIHSAEPTNNADSAVLERCEEPISKAAQGQLGKIRVLLLSPVAGLDVACGDTTYTQTLVACPPPAVQYETYDQAVARGTLRERTNPTQYRFASRSPSQVFLDRSLWAFSGVTNRLRSAGIAFREPLRFFDVEPGQYDLIHCHVFSATFRSIDCPVVFSSATDLWRLYGHARGWSTTRLALARALDLLMGRVLQANVMGERCPQAAALLPFTERFGSRWGDRNPGTPAVAIPNYLPDADIPTQRRRTRPPSRVAFVAKDFAAKGGDALIDAWPSVRSAQPNATLDVVTETTEPQCLPDGVCWHGALPRHLLLDTLLPSCDVFVYPSRFDGLPYLLLEAMAVGLPSVVSDYDALPDIVGDAGLVVAADDRMAIANAVLSLLDAEENARVSTRALQRFASHYSATSVAPKLRAAYDLAIAHCHRAETTEASSS